MSVLRFLDRHIGPGESEISEMLSQIGVNSLDELINQTIPEKILLKSKLELDEPYSENDYLERITEIARQNKVLKSYIGMGYYNTSVLSVVKRNILENPSWYTSYTPYQAEISQGRLEALLNFQTMVMSLTGMELANSSLLDEATAAAEAMIMMYNLRSRAKVKEGINKFFVDINVFPQSLAVMKTRANPLGIEIVVADYKDFKETEGFFGSVVQYPAADGKIREYSAFVQHMHNNDILCGAIADIMSLVLLTPPGEWGADIVMGSTQRFGIPMGYGGPHAAYFATREKYKRNIPGRIIGVSLDKNNDKALRLALQTREQHIKREKATSNICTAQALLATMAGMYAVYHGPEGIKGIAQHIHYSASLLSDELEKLGYKNLNDSYFDTLKLEIPESVSMDEIKSIAISKGINFRYIDNMHVGISTDENITLKDINSILEIFAQASKNTYLQIGEIVSNCKIEKDLLRSSEILKENIFSLYRSETDLMRYIKKLERKDISLTHSMISLGSCTMKLNAATEMMAFLWPEFANIHPYVPLDQVEGYTILLDELKEDLKKITGFADISFQPNSGAAGEYTGLMVIRAYHHSRGDAQRNVMLIPASAHGTNPASAVMAGMKVIVVPCDEKGNINVEALTKLAEENKEKLAGSMITYPSTHGVFEKKIVEIIDAIHENGGQVYMDGANMNAQVCLTNPGYIGADVCHLNLHKTFAIPHGGGGPGAGPIGVATHLTAFLPGHPVVQEKDRNLINTVSSAPYGSASILTITHAYIKMLGEEGLSASTKIAILNANYLATQLDKYYKVLYTGELGRVGHEMILDCRDFKGDTGITESDIAKRLMDYGFHAPTLSFPVHGTLMVEPTESESKAELDRFIQSMKSIYHEIQELKNDETDLQNNVLKMAPHTMLECSNDNWDHPYSRKKAAYPLEWIAENKFWPAVARLDDAYGDRNLMCSCRSIESYSEE